MGLMKDALDALLQLPFHTSLKKLTISIIRQLYQYSYQWNKRFYSLPLSLLTLRKFTANDVDKFVEDRYHSCTEIIFLRFTCFNHLPLIMG